MSDLVKQVKHFGQGGTVENPVALIRNVVTVLEQVEQLHQSVVTETCDDRWLCCKECGQDWPCTTAKALGLS